MKRAILLIFYLVDCLNSTGQQCDIIKTVLLNYYDGSVTTKSNRSISKPINLCNEFITYYNSEKNSIKEDISNYVPSAIAKKFAIEVEHLDAGGTVDCFDSAFNFITKTQADSINQCFRKYGSVECTKNPEALYKYNCTFITQPIIIGNFAIIKEMVYVASLNSTTNIYLFKQVQGKFVFHKTLYSSAS